MADYIRGKKAYTKWDVDAENVDLDLPSDGGRQHLHHKPKVIRPGCFTGSKGKVVKVLLLVVVFLLGLILGYIVRRGVHEVIQHRISTTCVDETGIYMFQNYNGRFFKKTVSNESIANFLRNFSSEVHQAGSESNRKFAESIRDSWKEFGFRTVRIENFNILISQPSNKLSSSVFLTDGSNEHRITVYEAEDDNSPSIVPYLAYSPNKTAKGKPVYAHYARPEDFEFLMSQNISLKGRIVIARNGEIHRGHKVLLAESLGAVGMVLFSDPANVVPENSHLAPDGIGLPGDGVAMGSLKIAPGDPLTPLTPSIDGMYRLPLANSKLPTIPVLPIGYNDAHFILQGIGGPEVPSHWQGKLNFTYKLGPGFNKPSENFEINVTVHNQLVQKDIFNVIAAIPGEYEPGRYVIIGCHHDSWSNGSSDPNSGLAILMELTRVFGLLVKEGWKPGRTLVFASWDAEEFGVSGSTEWIQYHAKELLHRAVAYINLDVAISGNYSLMAVGSPLLRQVLKEATSDVEWTEEGHEDSTVYDIWKSRMPRDKNSAQKEPEIIVPGSGSDFVGFFAGQGISTVHLQFIDKNRLSNYPLYHTVYDQYNVIANHVDRQFNVAQTLTKVIGILLMKMTDNLHLPMKAEDYSDHVQKHLNSFVWKYKTLLSDNDIALEPLGEANEKFKKACQEFHDNYETVNRNNLLLALRQYNDRLIELERSFLLPPTANSLQPNFRHSVYGPNLSNVYEGIAFPHLVAAIEKARSSNDTQYWEGVKEQLSYVVYALLSAEGVLSNQILLKKDEL